MDLEVYWPKSRDHYLTIATPPPPDSIDEEPVTAQKSIATRCREWLQAQAADAWFPVQTLALDLLPSERDRGHANTIIAIALRRAWIAERVERRKTGPVFEYRWKRA